jgi:beta-glucosidase
VHVVLGPGINIKRSPLCGRNFEYFSEDPLVSGVLGAALVHGLQAQGVGASVKHFAANNQETDRARVSADVDERTLQEIYLPAFERVITEASPWTVMCSYNRINGTYASQSSWLLTEVLRDEWGFDGLVVSDWGAVHDRVAALAAGLDLEMPPKLGVDDEAIVAAVRAGEIDERLLDQAVGRVLALVDRALARGDAADGFDVDAHHALARAAAAECAVLLKNEGSLLPLAPTAGDTIAVIGEFARRPRYLRRRSVRRLPRLRRARPRGQLPLRARPVLHELRVRRPAGAGQRPGRGRGSGSRGQLPDRQHGTAPRQGGRAPLRR